MELLTNNAEVLASKANQWFQTYLGASPSLSDFDEDNFGLLDDDNEDATARLFFLVLNTSTTLTTAQALALVLGITALLGALAAAAYFFLLNMKDDSGYGHSGYGHGGHSGDGGGEYGGHGHGHSKRSLDDFSLGNVEVVSLVAELEAKLNEQEPEKHIRTAEKCLPQTVCQFILEHDGQTRVYEIFEELNDIFETPLKDMMPDNIKAKVKAILTAGQAGERLRGQEPESCSTSFPCQT